MLQKLKVIVLEVENMVFIFTRMVTKGHLMLGFILFVFMLPVSLPIGLIKIRKCCGAYEGR